MNLRFKNYLYIAYFFILVLVGDRFFVHLLTSQIINKSEFRYSRLYSGRAQADILLIGNSRGLSFYQPELEKLTHNTTFNLSYNGLPTNLAKVFFTDYLKIYTKPKLVIIEATIRGKRTELVTNFGCYSMHSTELNDLINKNRNSFLYDLFHLTKFNGEIFQRAAYFLNKSDVTWLNERVISTRMLDVQLDEKLQKFDFDEAAAADLKSIIEMCKQNKIKYRLIINPYLPEYRNKLIHFDDQKKRLSNYLGEEILDYSRAIENSELFSDYLHVNKSGGTELMNILFKDSIFVIDESN